MLIVGTNCLLVALIFLFMADSVQRRFGEMSPILVIVAVCFFCLGIIITISKL